MKKSDIHCVVRNENASSFDQVAANKFIVDKKNFNAYEKIYVTQTVINIEKRSFLKKMPIRTFITHEEKTLS